MPTTTATVHVDPRRTVAPIDRRIFGGFLEHLGRAVYGGVYDRSTHSFREDVAAAVRDLRMPVVRYPGGNFVSAYDWRDGVGPRERRPRRADFAWRSIEPNEFGTDEFVAWCRLVGAEPMLAVNLGTGTPSDAAQLLEYCNLEHTTIAEQRNAPPHGVKLWCLGNEMDGPWQAGHVSADVYAERARTAARLMKGLDPSIEVVACGSSGRMMPTYMSWDRTVLEHCHADVDFISAHRYSRKRDFASFLAEGVAVDEVIGDYRHLIGYVRARTRSRRTVHLSFDEWNVWYRETGGNGRWQVAPPLLEERYTHEDALVCAQYLNSFVRNADVVKVACLAQVVNVIAPIVTSDTGVVRQTIYWPFAMLSEATRATALDVAVDAPTYDCARGTVPALDVAASTDGSTITLSLVNRDPDAPLRVDVPGFTPVRACVLHAPLDAVNDFDRPDAVVPQDADPRDPLPGAALAVVDLQPA